MSEYLAHEELDEQPFFGEPGRVRVWRFEEFRRLGFGTSASIVLMDVGADLCLARQLIGLGRPYRTAQAILRESNRSAAAPVLSAWAWTFRPDGGQWARALEPTPRSRVRHARQAIVARPSGDISLHVVDDDAIVRAWARAALAGSEFRVAGEAGRANDALELVERRRPDLLLVDQGTVVKSSQPEVLLAHWGACSRAKRR